MAEEDIVFEAIFSGVSYLRKTHGIDMGSEQLNSYVDIGRVKDFVLELKKDKKFKRLKGVERTELLTKNVQKYILDYQPFNEQGKKILEGGLESMVGKSSLFKKIFSTEEGRKK